MKLEALDYEQWQGHPHQWRLQTLELRPINLIVGRNATGKSRALNVIYGLAQILSGELRQSLLSGSWKAVFDDDGRKLTYELAFDQEKVTREKVTDPQRTLLDRGPGGTGRIYAEKLKQEIDFQSPDNAVAAFARRDGIQHPFLDPFYQWGKSAFRYEFGSSLGKERLVVFVTGKPPNPRNTNEVIEIFKLGQREFKEPFVQTIITDMAAVGYDLETIEIKEPTSVRIGGTFLSPPVGMTVKERDLPADTDQPETSQGMFRALSLLIQLNYAVLSLKPSLFLIDDIGEGLDFERACSMIKLLMGKAQKANVQLVMTTNDKFVMNEVPLEAWTVLHREPGLCRVFNYQNSREAFDNFRFTGLSNFDLFAVDYLTKKERKGNGGWTG